MLSQKKYILSAILVLPGPVTALTCAPNTQTEEVQILLETAQPDPNLIKTAAETQKALKPLLNQFSQSFLYSKQAQARQNFAEVIVQFQKDYQAAHPGQAVPPSVEAEVVSKALMTEGQSDTFKKSAGLLQTYTNQGILHGATYSFNDPANLAEDTNVAIKSLENLGIKINTDKTKSSTGKLIQLDQIQRALASDPLLADSLKDVEIVLVETKGAAPKISQKGRKIQIEYDAHNWDKAFSHYSNFSSKELKGAEDTMLLDKEFAILALDNEGSPKWMVYNFTMLYGNPNTFRGTTIQGGNKRARQDAVTTSGGKGIVTARNFVIGLQQEFSRLN